MAESPTISLHVPAEAARDFEGRGIVTCAGGERLFLSAYVLLRLLRETLGCTLPIQLWHFGGREITPAMRTLLRGLDVELVDATAVLQVHPANIANGWQLKAYAVLHSRFAEVLYLDADQVPVRDPSEVFDWPQYKAGGAVFWPDIIDLRADNPIWASLGLKGENVVSWESGQLVVDKRRHLKALGFALQLNEQAETVYKLLYGDKDTFLAAWRVAGADAAVVPHRPFIDSRILIQRDFESRPFLQHRTGSKWTYHGEQYTIDGLAHHDACMSFLADLRKAWNGRSFFPPDRSETAEKEEARLAGIGEVRLTILADHDVKLQFLEGCQLGSGRSLDRQNWYVRDAQDGLELVMHDGDHITYRLQRPEGQNYWAGEKLSFPRTEVRLDELAGSAGPEQYLAKSGLVREIVAASGWTEGSSGQLAAGLAATLRIVLRARPGVRAEIEQLAREVPAFRPVAQEVLSDPVISHDRISGGETIREGYDAMPVVRI